MDSSCITEVQFWLNDPANAAIKLYNDKGYLESRNELIEHIKHNTAELDRVCRNYIDVIRARIEKSTLKLSIITSLN